MKNDQQAVLSERQAENARLIGLLEAHGYRVAYEVAGALWSRLP